MDKREALSILKAELSLFREKSYEELAQLVGGDPYLSEVRTETGKWYQMEVEVFWDGKPRGGVRVSGSIDNGGWRAFFPLTECFVKPPPGARIEE